MLELTTPELRLAWTLVVEQTTVGTLKRPSWLGRYNEAAPISTLSVAFAIATGVSVTGEVKNSISFDRTVTVEAETGRSK